MQVFNMSFGTIEAELTFDSDLLID